jgi:hypothetical protein
LWLAAINVAGVAIFTLELKSMDATKGQPIPNSMGKQSGNDLFLRDAVSGLDMGGRSIVSPNSTINWQSAGAIDSEGATIEAVLNATAARLSHLQQTPAANDRYAQALFEVVKALDILEGK